MKTLSESQINLLLILPFAVLLKFGSFGVGFMLAPLPIVAWLFATAIALEITTAFMIVYQQFYGAYGVIK